MKRSAKRMWMLAGAAFFVLHSSFLISCSEEEAEASEYDNWQERNEVYFATLADSLDASPMQWERILKYSLSGDNAHDAGKYIYVKKLENGGGTVSPAYSDSVRVIYQGRLIPTATYPEGKVFSTTVNGSFSMSTAYTTKGVVSGYVAGFSTALQRMHRGDYWRIYIPNELGYGENEQTTNPGIVTVPAYSTLIFDLQLVDFSPAGEPMPRWSSRERKQ